MSDRRSVVMTFKVEPELAQLLRKQANTSEFIRGAVRDKIGNVCPLCTGTGRVGDLQAMSAQHRQEEIARVADSAAGAQRLELGPERVRGQSRHGCGRAPGRDHLFL